MEIRLTNPDIKTCNYITIKHILLFKQANKDFFQILKIFENKFAIRKYRKIFLYASLK